MSQNQIEGKAIAAETSAEKAYDWAITTRDHFTALLDAIPLDKPELQQYIRTLHNEADNAIAAAWEAKHAMELALEALQKEGLRA